MSRSARTAVGAVVCFVLVLVAAVSALVAVVANAQSDADWFSGMEDGEQFFMDPVEAEAEVLDVDGVGEGWVSVDVRFTTTDGDVEISAVDLGEEGGTTVPEVGDTVAVVYERDFPQSVLRADDPMLTGQPVRPEDPSAQPLEDRAAVTAALVRRVGTLALVSLALAVVAAAVTVVAVRRAPTEVALPENTQA